MIYEINDDIEFKSDKGDLVLFVSDKEIARDKLSTASMQIDYKVFNMLYEYLTSNDGYKGVGYFSGTLKETTKEVAQIEIWMNNYPRKMFNYSTPIQVYLGG